jgi:tetratricopeptide (TPR) repeat protein
MPALCPRRLIALTLATAVLLPAAHAQPTATSASATSAGAAPDVAAVIAGAERDRAAFNAAAALGRYETALAAAPTTYALLWRASREATDLGEAASNSATRTEYYTKGEAYARRAVAANPNGADGHFMLAVALGRAALSVSSRERVKYAAEIRTAALAAVRIEPTHAGALHVLGVWNAEIMRLNSFTRFAARKFLGGKVFGEASWPEAIRYMEAAVAADPVRITHRLDLAMIYADTGDKAKARANCDAVAGMANTELNDTRYKQQCARLLTRL